MGHRLQVAAALGLVLLGAGVALLGLGLAEGPPPWPGSGPRPAAWPGAWALGPWHAGLGGALALLLAAGGLALLRPRPGLPRRLALLAGLDLLLALGSGLALAPGGWRDGGLPAGLAPWAAEALVEAAAEAHAASALALPLLVAVAVAAARLPSWRAAGRAARPPAA